MTLHIPYKPFALLTLAAALSACSTTVDRSGGTPVVRTDAGASVSKMWSQLFNNKLRSAPQPQYQFGSGAQNYGAYQQASGQPIYGGEDATLNTQRLQGRLSGQNQNYGQAYYPAAQQGTVPQLRRHAETRIQSRSAAPQTYRTAQPYAAQPYSAPTPSANARPISSQPLISQPAASPQKKSLGYRIGSLFRGSKHNTAPSTEAANPLSGYETQRTRTQIPQAQPSQSQGTIQTPPPPRAQPVYNAEAEYGGSTYDYGRAPSPASQNTYTPAPAPAPAPTPAQSVASAPAPQPAPQTASVYTPNAQAKTEGSSARRVADIDSSSLSYVKLGGGSNIADWESCEKTAGGYFIPSSTGFSVLPAFDSCMRGKGYKSEAEAIAALERSPR